MRIPAALLVALSLAAPVAAQPNPDDFDLPAAAADPLYHVELILFAFNEGDRFEEDFLHGIDDPQFGPPLELLRAPTIELDTVFGGRPGDGLRLPGADLPSDPGLPAAADASASASDASGIAAEPVSADPFALPGQVTGANAADNPNGAIEPLRDRLELIGLATSGEPGLAVNTLALPDGFRRLARDELELSNVAARMNRRPYTLLGHAGWVQTGVDTDRSVAIDLMFLGITNPTGSIEVYARRYLHAVVDFDFHDGSGTFWSAPGVFGVAPLEYSQSFKVRDEINAIRSGNDLWQIDHPLFGVLIQIRRAPDPVDPTGSSAAGGPAG